MKCFFTFLELIDMKNLPIWEQGLHPITGYPAVLTRFRNKQKDDEYNAKRKMKRKTNGK
tara:strand:- start:727 stop:903 length:177 start_codon:yes stop_codon:yes gene_type:complete